MSDELELWEEIGWEGYGRWEDDADVAFGPAAEDDVNMIVAWGPDTPDGSMPRSRHKPDLWQPEDKDREWRPRQRRAYKPRAREPLRFVVRKRDTKGYWYPAVHIIPDPVWIPEDANLCQRRIDDRKYDVVTRDDMIDRDYRFCTTCLSRLRHSPDLRDRVISELKDRGFDKPVNWRSQYGKWS